MKIKISETEQKEEGYLFDIWLDENSSDDDSPDDGGLCTGTYEDAIQMACDLAKDLVIISKVSQKS
jgi:hypothetical protein